jgi:hypothetical protein
MGKKDPGTAPSYHTVCPGGTRIVPGSDWEYMLRCPALQSRGKVKGGKGGIAAVRKAGKTKARVALLQHFADEPIIRIFIVGTTHTAKRCIAASPIRKDPSSVLTLLLIVLTEPDRLCHMFLTSTTTGLRPIRSDQNSDLSFPILGSSRKACAYLVRSAADPKAQNLKTGTVRFRVRADQIWIRGSPKGPSFQTTPPKASQEPVDIFKLTLFCARVESKNAQFLKFFCPQTRGKSAQF